MVSIYSNPKSASIQPEYSGYNYRQTSVQALGKSLQYPALTRFDNNYSTEFARIIYGDGPYSLVRPNNTTDYRAVYFDYSA